MDWAGSGYGQWWAFVNSVMSIWFYKRQEFVNMLLEYELQKDLLRTVT
jgi:hypothetical protein